MYCIIIIAPILSIWSIFNFQLVWWRTLKTNYRNSTSCDLISFSKMSLWLLYKTFFLMYMIIYKKTKKANSQCLLNVYIRNKNIFLKVQIFLNFADAYLFSNTYVLHIYIYNTYMYIYMYVYIYVLCIYIFNIYIYIYVYVYIYIYIHIFMYSHWHAKCSNITYHRNTMKVINIQYYENNASL